MPQQKGIVERKHQHILSVTCAIIFNLIYLKKWANALSHDDFLINRLHSKFLKLQTPFTILNNSLPDYSTIKIFRCLVFASIPNHNRSKLDLRSCTCFYLGNKNGVKGNILYDLKPRVYFLYMDTIF